MALYDRVADLPPEVEGVGLDRREMDTSAGFTPGWTSTRTPTRTSTGGLSTPSPARFSRTPN